MINYISLKIFLLLLKIKYLKIIKYKLFQFSKYFKKLIPNPLP